MSWCKRSCSNNTVQALRNRRFMRDQITSDRLKFLDLKIFYCRQLPFPRSPSRGSAIFVFLGISWFGWISWHSSFKSFLMVWKKLCKSNWNCAWNLALPVFISPIVWNMCENLHYESIYFKELHRDEEYYWPRIYKAGVAVVSIITSDTNSICLWSQLVFHWCRKGHKANI